MKRLKISVNRSNLSTLVDTFINHGKLSYFPWLIAHNYSFFGNFNNLQALDTLLTHRRGFNLNIGSRVRKIYFSDVNIILEKSDEQRLTFCEKFKPSLSIEKTRDVAECVCMIHSIEEIENFSIIEDDFDPLFDEDTSEFYNRDIGSMKKGYRFEDLTKEDSRFRGFFKNLLSYDVILQRKFKNKKFKEKIEAIKRERSKMIEPIYEEINEINEQLSKIPDPIDFVLFEETLLKDQIGMKKLNLLKTILDHLINLFENFDYVFQPLNELANSSGVYAPSNRRFLDDKINIYFSRKSEKKFLTLGEISHRCKQNLLKDKVEEYNEKRDMKESMLEALKRMPKSEQMKSMKEFKKLASEVDSLGDEAQTLIAIYTEITENFSDPDRFKRPKNLRPILKMLKNENYELEEMWSNLCRGVNKERFFEKLKELKDKIEHDSSSFLDDLYGKAVGEVIKEIYEKEKEYILGMINENKTPNVRKLENDYEEIKKSRKNFLLSKQKEILSFNGLNLNDYEKKIFYESKEYLEANERSHIINMETMMKKQTTMPDGKQNRMLFARHHGIDINLSHEEWVRAVFELKKPEIEMKISEFYKVSKRFSEIAGYSPYGLIIGTETPSKGKDEDVGIDETCYNETPRWQENAMNRVLDITKDICEKYENAENMGCSYLRVLKNNRPLKKNAFIINQRGRLKGFLDELEKKKEALNIKNTDEVIYDIVVDSENENLEEKWVQRKNGIKIKLKSRKIENDFNSRILRRNVADKIFRKMIEEVAVKTENKFEELEVEEAITDSSMVVENLFKSEVTPYYCFDYKRLREYNRKKRQELKMANEEEEECFNRQKFFNIYDIENNSNANKKYNVCCSIEYIKILCAMRLLKLNVNSHFYKYFGFKKCQSDYLKDSLAKLANKLLKNKII